MHSESKRSSATIETLSTKIVETKAFTNERFSASIIQYQPTDRLIEDRCSLSNDEAHNRLIVGVYDGHGGASTAQYVSRELPSRLAKVSPHDHVQTFIGLDQSIMKAFQDDHMPLRQKSEDWIANAEVIKSGCTALICDIDLDSMIATVSNAGDSRLLVCRKRTDLEQETKFTVSYETNDLNARNPAEVDRLKTEHPGEDMVVVGGRLFGRLMSTRGFGDGYYKLPAKGFLGKCLHKRYIDVLSSIEKCGKVPMNAQYEGLFYGYRTPPYVTAQPETTVVNLCPGDILILATDGLWDRLSSEAVASVIDHLPSAGQDNMALSILHKAMECKPPGDDVTILTIKLH